MLGTQAVLFADLRSRAVVFGPGDAAPIVSSSAQPILATRRGTSTVVIEHGDASSLLCGALPLVFADECVGAVDVGCCDAFAVGTGDAETVFGACFLFAAGSVGEGDAHAVFGGALSVLSAGDGLEAVGLALCLTQACDGDASAVLFAHLG